MYCLDIGVSHRKAAECALQARESFVRTLKSLQFDGGEMPETLGVFVGLIHPQDR